MTETNWLKKNKDRLSIRAIEIELGIPATTLSKVSIGTMKLPDKWKEPLRVLILDMAI